MSGYEDTEHARRHKAPYSAHHPIPTIAKFRQEKEARRVEAEAREHEHDEENSAALKLHRTENSEQQDGEEQQIAAAPGRESVSNDHGSSPMVDTSEAHASATDPRARRKELKKRKDERAERVVTDPVTHLPITIHDLGADSLKEVPENDEPFGSTSKTATGVNNRMKSEKELQDEAKQLQRGHDSMRALFPPPKYNAIKHELQHIYKVGVAWVLVGTAAVVVVMSGVERFVRYELNNIDTSRIPVIFAIWVLPALIALVTIGGLAKGVRHFMSQRIENIWDDAIWDAKRQQAEMEEKGRETETVKWLNSLLASVWPLINPDLFVSLADTLEDVMQASLPRMIQMVSVDDIGQGSESIRILGVRWLSTGAAARSVTEDGKFKDPENNSNHGNDRKVPGQGAMENTGGNVDNNNKTQQTEDGSQQQISEGMEAEEGDFVNMEIAFAYRARSNKRKNRAKDMHLYIAFYLPGNLKIPVWVSLHGIVGSLRMRLQLCPDPPFFSLCTLSFMGQPHISLSCLPISKHAVNIMDVPLISNFVQSAVDAGLAELVAPKSLTLDLKDMLSGDDFKRDVTTHGILVVNIKRGYDFTAGDPGIWLLKELVFKDHMPSLPSNGVQCYANICNRGSSDPYVSVGWAKFGKPVWSTRLILKDMEPYFNETAYVLVGPDELNVDERIRLQLWDSDRFDADDDLGRIEVDLKEIMKNPESDGRMSARCDSFTALDAGQTMPGRLEWSVGYFSKIDIQPSQLEKQTFDASINTKEEMNQRVEETTQRKLREAMKGGRHKRDADELDQQRAQEMKSMQDNMIISAPPLDDYPSGIFSIQIHQITGLELEKLSKTKSDKEAEADDEEEEGEGLPSAYCTVIINHNKVFKTRTKPKNSKPFFNAGTERFIADWRNTEVYVSVRDARVKEDDALLGIVHLPLDEVFKERAQINGFYPLAGGIGFGRIRISMVWRSVQLQASTESLGWQYGTVEVANGISVVDMPKDLHGYIIKFHTDLGSAKMYPSKNEDGSWSSKNQKSLKLPVRKRYSSCLGMEFRHHSVLTEKTAAFGTFWLRDIPDNEPRDVTLTLWNEGDFKRALQNDMPDLGTKIGSLKLKLTFWNGLGSAHSRFASKDKNVRDVAEVLEVSRNDLDTMHNEAEVGVVDGNASDSSDSDSEENGERNGLFERAKSFKKHNQDLNKKHRGLMQWKIPRTARWAKHKVEASEGAITNLFTHHTRQPGIETEV